MKLNVPFYKQTTNLDCGPTALRMALSFLNKDYGIEKLRNLVITNDDKGVSTIKLAIAASKLGYKTKFYSVSLFFDESNLDLDFYKQYGDINLEISKKLVEEAKKNKVELYEKSISLEDVLSYVTEESIPIILLDWNIIREISQKGYQGHFVPIVGYDDNYVYVHNQGLKDPQAYLPIKKETFEKARKAQGTDEDFLVIFKQT